MIKPFNYADPENVNTDNTSNTGGIKPFNYELAPKKEVAPVEKVPLIKDNSTLGIVKNTITGLADPRNLPLGVGEIVKQAQDDPETVYNLTFEDVLQGLVDTSKGTFKGLIKAGANFIPKETKFNVPGLGEVTNAQFNAAQRIRNGEDPLIVTVEEGTGAIFDTLMLVGLASEIVGVRPTVIAKGQVPEGITTKTQPKSFRLYNEPVATQTLTPEFVQKMAESKGVNLGKFYDPTLPTYFKMTGKANGQITGEVVQLKPSYLDTFLKSLKGNTSKVPESEVTTLISSTVSKGELKTLKPTPIVRPTVSPDGQIKIVSETPEVIPFKAPVETKPQTIFHGTSNGKLSVDENGNINFGTVASEIAQFNIGTESKPIEVSLKDLNVKEYATKQELFDAVTKGKQELLSQGIDVAMADNHAIAINTQKIAQLTDTPLSENFLDQPISKMVPQEKTAEILKKDKIVVAKEKTVAPAKQGYTRYTVIVDGQTFFADYNPQPFKGGGQVHVEFHSSGPNPVSETGYKSNFMSGTSESLGITKENIQAELQKLAERLAKEDKPLRAKRAKEEQKTAINKEIVKTPITATNKSDINVGDTFNTNGVTNMESPVTVTSIEGRTVKFRDGKGTDFSGMEKSLVKKFLDEKAWSKVGTTQKEKVAESIKSEPKTIKQIAEETKILEPNVRRILGVGAKEGTFERLDKGVYILSKDGVDMAYIHTGDAVTTLPKLVADGLKADMVFLDIPYKTGAVKGGNRGAKYNLISTDEFQTVVDSLKDLVKGDNTPVFYMYSQAESGLKQMEVYNNIFAESFIPVARGEYTKLQKDGITRTRNMRGNNDYPEAIIVGSKSGELDFENPNLNFKLIRPRGYQTEKPAEMIRKMIEMSTNEGDIVLDPFAGSGVTGAEAVKAGRKAVLVEKNPTVSEEITRPRVKKAVDSMKEISMSGILNDLGRKGTASFRDNEILKPTGVEKVSTEALDEFIKQGENQVDKSIISNIIKTNGKDTQQKGISDSGDLPAGNDMGGSSETTGEISGYDRATMLVEPRNGLGAKGSNGLSKKDRQLINEQVEQLLEERDYSVSSQDYSQDDIRLMQNYSGAGGKEAVGGEGAGLLNEYYTPQPVIEKLWEIAERLNPTMETAFEPSAGTGKIINNAPANVQVDGAEISKVSGTIARILNPESNITIGDFQEIFFDKTTNKQKPVKKYDLLIGNPPFGTRGGFLKGKGEESDIGRMEEYFIKRGLDMTKDGGHLVYVVNSSFLKTGLSKGKEGITKVGRLIDAYRLPEGSFEDTTIGTDIVVFEKLPTLKGNDSVERLEMVKRSREIVDDAFFNKQKDNVLGETKTRKNRFGQMETYVTGDLETAVSKIGLNKAVKKTVSSEILKPKNSTAKVVEDWNKKVEANRTMTAEEGNKMLENYKVGDEVKITNKKDGTVRVGIVTGLFPEKLNDVGQISTARVGVDTNKNPVFGASRFNFDSHTITKHTLTPSELKQVKAEKAKIKDGQDWLSMKGKYAEKPVVARTKKDSQATLPKKNAKDLVTPLQDVSNRKTTNQAEVTMLKRINRDMSIPEPTQTELQFLNYQNGDYIPDTIYFSGSIYEKIDYLKANKKEIVDATSEAQYEKQLSGLQAIIPTPVAIKDIAFDPIDRHVAELKMKDDNDNEVTVLSDFKRYLRNNSVSLSPRVQKWDVIRYVNGDTASKDTKPIMGLIKNDAKRLFNHFLKNELDVNVQKQITDKYNREKNGFVRPDYSKLPVEVKDMAKDFRGREFKMSQTQKEGVGFLVNKGSGAIAYGVGVGKTHTLAVATKANMDKGWTKRPLFTVPKSTIDKTWINTLHEMFPTLTINNLEGLQAPVIARLKRERGLDPKNWIQDGEFTIISHEGLLRLGFKEEELRSAAGDLQDALWREPATKREGEQSKTKYDEILGNAQKYVTDVMLSDLGFDHISVDEVHNFRKIFQGAKPEKVDEQGKSIGKKRYGNVVGGTPSKRAQQLFLIAQQIQKTNGNRNVFLASATPFENHATEVYNILSLVARDRMKEMGILNINDFFSTFANFEVELDRKLNGEWLNTEKMKSFSNLPALQSLIREFIDLQEDTTLVRPERRVITPQLQMSDMQIANLEKIQDLLRGITRSSENPDLMNKGEVEDGAFLKASTYSIANGVSPFFIKEYTKGTPTAEELVSQSPKIQYAIEAIRAMKNDPKTADFGTFVFFGKMGVEYHPMLAEYFAKELGYKRSEVANLSGDVTDEQKEIIKEKFNNGDIKVLLGGDQTKEGIDLQNNGFATINLALGWNPTQIAQVEGRVWRQGNRRNIAPLIYPLVENSGDAMIYNKFEEKGGRINDLFSYAGQVFDVGEIDPSEKRLSLLTNPEDKAKMQIEINKVTLYNERVLIDNDAKELTKLRGDLKESKGSIKYFEEQSTYEYNSKERKAEYKKELKRVTDRVDRLEAKLKSKGITNLDESIGELEGKVLDIDNQIKEIDKTYPDVLAEFTKQYNEQIKLRKTMSQHIDQVRELISEVKERTPEEVEMLRNEKIAQLEQSRANVPVESPATKINKVSSEILKSPKGPSGGAKASMASPQGKKTLRKIFERVSSQKPTETQETPTDFKISERAKEIIKEFGVLSGERELSNRYLGLYKPLVKKIRVQSYYDITTVTHEVVHAIDDQIGFTKKIIDDPLGRKKGGVRKQLTDIYEALYPKGKRTHKLERRMSEGLAVLFENYFYDPVNTTKAYPELVDAFIKPSGKYHDPLFTKLLDRMNTLVEDYSKLSPEDRIASRIRTGKEIVDKQSGFTLAQRIVFEVSNRFEPLKRYAKVAGVSETWDDPVIQAFNILNKNSIIYNWVKGNETPILMKDGNFTIEKGAVADYLKLVKGSEKEWRSYLVARRVFEANNNVIALKNTLEELEAQGMTEESINNDGVSIIKELEDKIQKIQKVIEADDFSTQDANAVVQKYGEKFAEAEKIYDDINKRLITFAEQNDLISQETADTYRAEKGYASFRRFIDDELDSLGTIKTSSKSKVSSFKERTGSQLDIIDPVYSQILAINEVVGKSMENRLWNKVYDLTKNNEEIAQRFEPLEVQTSVDPKGRVSFPQEKDPNVIRIFVKGKRMFFKAGPEFLAIAKTLRGKEFDAFVQLLRVPASIFTRLTTSANPFFAVGNLTVDQFSATTQTKTGYKPIIDPAKGLYDYVMGDEGLKAYYAIGGKKQTLASYYDLSPDEIVHSLTGGETKTEKVVGVVDSALGVLEWPSNISEIVTRYGEYKRSVAKGESMSVAMYRASEVTTPFQLQGNFGGRLGQEYIKAIPYLNATIQVLYKFGRTTKDNPKRVGSMLAGLLAVGLTAAILTMKKASEKQKRLLSEQPTRNMSRYLYFPSPNGEDLIKMRIPEQFGIFTGMAYLFTIQNYGGNKATFDDYADVVTSAFPEQINFLNPKKQVMSFIPQVLKPSVSVSANAKTFPEVAPIVPAFVVDRKPSEQYNAYTSKVAKFVGQLTNSSPMLIDYWVKNQFGVVGGVLVGKLPTDPINIQEKDFVMSGRAYNRFYDNRELVNQQYTDVNSNPKKYSFKEIIDIKAEHKAYATIADMLSDMRKINNTKDIPEDIKTGMYDLLVNLNDESVALQSIKINPLKAKINAFKNLNQIK